MATPEVITIAIRLTPDEATALARLAGRMDEAACAQYAGQFVTYGPLCRIEAAVMADAMAAVCSTLGVAGFLTR